MSHERQVPENATLVDDLDVLDKFFNEEVMSRLADKMESNRRLVSKLKQFKARTSNTIDNFNKSVETIDDRFKEGQGKYAGIETLTSERAVAIESILLALEHGQVVQSVELESVLDRVLFYTYIYDEEGLIKDFTQDTEVSGSGPLLTSIDGYSSKIMSEFERSTNRIITARAKVIKTRNEVDVLVKTLVVMRDRLDHKITRLSTENTKLKIGDQGFDGKDGKRFTGDLMDVTLAPLELLMFLKIQRQKLDTISSSQLRKRGVDGASYSLDGMSNISPFDSVIKQLYSTTISTKATATPGKWICGASGEKSALKDLKTENKMLKKGAKSAAKEVSGLYETIDNTRVFVQNIQRMLYINDRYMKQLAEKNKAYKKENQDLLNAQKGKPNMVTTETGTNNNTNAMGVGAGGRSSINDNELNATGPTSQSFGFGSDSIVQGIEKLQNSLFQKTSKGNGADSSQALHESTQALRGTRHGDNTNTEQRQLEDELGKLAESMNTIVPNKEPVFEGTPDELKSRLEANNLQVINITDKLTSYLRISESMSKSGRRSKFRATSDRQYADSDSESDMFDDVIDSTTAVPITVQQHKDGDQPDTNENIATAQNDRVLNSIRTNIAAPYDKDKGKKRGRKGKASRTKKISTSGLNGLKERLAEQEGLKQSITGGGNSGLALSGSKLSKSQPPNMTSPKTERRSQSNSQQNTDVYQTPQGTDRQLNTTRRDDLMGSRDNQQNTKPPFFGDSLPSISRGNGKEATEPGWRPIAALGAINDTDLDTSDAGQPGQTQIVKADQGKAATNNKTKTETKGDMARPKRGGSFWNLLTRDNTTDKECQTELLDLPSFIVERLVSFPQEVLNSSSNLDVLSHLFGDTTAVDGQGNSTDDSTQKPRWAAPLYQTRRITKGESEKSKSSIRPTKQQIREEVRREREREKVKEKEKEVEEEARVALKTAKVAYRPGAFMQHATAADENEEVRVRTQDTVRKKNVRDMSDAVLMSTAFKGILPSPDVDTPANDIFDLQDLEALLPGISSSPIVPHNVTSIVQGAYINNLDDDECAIDCIKYDSMRVDSDDDDEFLANNDAINPMANSSERDGNGHRRGHHHHHRHHKKKRELADGETEDGHEQQESESYSDDGSQDSKGGQQSTRAGRSFLKIEPSFDTIISNIKGLCTFKRELGRTIDIGVIPEANEAYDGELSDEIDNIARGNEMMRSRSQIRRMQQQNQQRTSPGTQQPKTQKQQSTISRQDHSALISMFKSSVGTSVSYKTEEIISLTTLIEKELYGCIQAILYIVNSDAAANDANVKSKLVAELKKTFSYLMVNVKYRTIALFRRYSRDYKDITLQDSVVKVLKGMIRICNLEMDTLTSLKKLCLTIFKQDENKSVSRSVASAPSLTFDDLGDINGREVRKLLNIVKICLDASANKSAQLTRQIREKERYASKLLMVEQYMKKEGYLDLLDDRSYESPTTGGGNKEEFLKTSPNFLVNGRISSMYVHNVESGKLTYVGNPLDGNKIEEIIRKNKPIGIDDFEDDSKKPKASDEQGSTMLYKRTRIEPLAPVVAGGVSVKNLGSQIGSQAKSPPFDTVEKPTTSSLDSTLMTTKLKTTGRQKTMDTRRGTTAAKQAVNEDNTEIRAILTTPPGSSTDDSDTYPSKREDFNSPDWEENPSCAAK